MSRVSIAIQGARVPGKYLLIVLSGAVFAGSIYALISLSTRWIVASVAVFILLCSCLFFISRLEDYLLITLFFSIPLAGIAKNVFPRSLPEDERGSVLYSGTLNFGSIGSSSFWSRRISFPCSRLRNFCSDYWRRCISSSIRCFISICREICAPGISIGSWQQ